MSLYSRRRLMHLSVVCPTLNTWGVTRVRRGPNGTSLHTWATILCMVLLHIPYKYPISPCCAQCVTGRYGNLRNSQTIFQRHVTQQKGIQMQFEWIGAIPTKYQLLGEDSYDRSHTILQHLPQVRQVGHTNDRHIR